MVLLIYSFIFLILHFWSFFSDVGLLYLIEHEAHSKLLTLLFKILRLLILSTPYVTLLSVLSYVFVVAVIVMLSFPYIFLLL